MRKATLNDSDKTIPVVFFRVLVNQIKNNNTYSFIDVRVFKFKCQRLLKTADCTPTTQCKSDMLVDTSLAEPIINNVTTYNSKVNTVDELTVRSQCKHFVVLKMVVQHVTAAITWSQSKIV